MDKFTVYCFKFRPSYIWVSIVIIYHFHEISLLDEILFDMWFIFIDVLHQDIEFIIIISNVENISIIIQFIGDRWGIFIDLSLLIIVFWQNTVIIYI